MIFSGVLLFKDPVLFWIRVVEKSWTRNNDNTGSNTQSFCMFQASFWGQGPARPGEAPQEVKMKTQRDQTSMTLTSKVEDYIFNTIFIFVQKLKIK